MKHFPCFSAIFWVLLGSAAPMWSQQPTTTGEGPLADDGGLQQVLQLFEIDESVLRFFVDGRGLTNDELEPVYRLLYVLPHIDALQRHRWSIMPDSWAPLQTDPAAHRAHLYQLMGRVVSITPHDLPAEAARRFGYNRFYLVDIATTLEAQVAQVAVRDIPRHWPVDPQGQPMSCDALFLKRGEGNDGDAPLLFVSDHISWHPQQSNAAPTIGPGQALLGMSGMDVGRFQDVAQQQPLVAADRECFYQMLWAVRRMDPQAIGHAARDLQLPVIRVLKNPEAEAGNVYRLRGTARALCASVLKMPIFDNGSALTTITSWISSHPSTAPCSWSIPATTRRAPTRIFPSPCASPNCHGECRKATKSGRRLKSRGSL